MTFTKQYILGYVSALEDISQMNPTKDVLLSEISRIRKEIKNSTPSHNQITFTDDEDLING